MDEFAKKLTQSVPPTTPRQGGDPDLVVTCYHMPADVEVIARDWFAGRITDFQPSGDRSVMISQAGDGYPQIKIKGAGLRGGAVQFGTYLDAGPVSPLFDYDGRRMEDVAAGHDGAFVGGASMQQAVTEWRVTHLVEEMGYRAVPCLGYGSVFDGQHRSWFSVFGWHDGWLATAQPPMGTIKVFEDLALISGEVTFRLAKEHRLAGYSWLIRDADGTPILKDLHPFRRLDPVNMSQVSWVMQTYHALHITAINTKIIGQNWFGKAASEHAPLRLFLPICPEATLEDWDRLRFSVVAKYMSNPHPDFSTEALLDLLEGNPISARLMALCPAEFAPVR